MKITLFAVIWAMAGVCAAGSMGFYYVSGNPGEHGIWRAHTKHDGTAWLRGRRVLINGAFDGDAVDPDVVRLPGGTLRLYYFRGFFITPVPPDPPTNRIFSALSTNGLHFSEEGIAFEYPGVADPSVVQTAAGHWLMACSRQTGSTTEIVLASSPNGKVFTYDRTFSPGGIPELARLDDGAIRLYYNAIGGIVSKISYDHGVTWSNEPGLRLDSGGELVADPSVVRVNATSWYLFVKGFLPGALPGSGPLYHKVMLAHGANPAAFAFADTNLMAQASVPEGLDPLVAPPIYINIVMHNEQNVRYDLIPHAFESHRTNLYKFALLMKRHNVMFNFQSDWTFLKGVTNFDRYGRPETGGTNIVAWLKHHMGFEVDEHNHVYESAYNYADVAALLASCGVEPPGIVGGFLGLPLSANEWPLYQQPVTGNVFTSYVWTPKILWGAATAGHTNETNLWFSGVYRPRSVEEFWSDQEGNLPMVGGYAGSTLNRSNITRLVELRDSGRLCPDALYTCSIFVRAGDVNDAYLANFDAFLSSYTNTPGLIWVGIRQVLDIWSNQYGAIAYYFPYDLAQDLDSDGISDGWETTNYCSITVGGSTTDLDGDSFSELEEYIADTRPRNPTSYPRPLTATANKLRIPITSPAREYFLLQSTNLIEGGWSEAIHAPGTGSALDFDFPADLSLNPAFFRYGARIP